MRQILTMQKIKAVSLLFLIIRYAELNQTVAKTNLKEEKTCRSINGCFHYFSVWRFGQR